MTGYTHMVVGGLTGGLAVAAMIPARKFGFDIGLHTIYPVACVMPAIWGALGPDIDIPQSKAGRKIRKILTYSMAISGVVLVMLSLIYVLAGESISGLLYPLICFAASVGFMIFITVSKHRRETHCGLLVIIMLAGLGIFMKFCSVNFISNIIISVVAGYIAGWLSHPIIDTFNGRGVAWLYPFTSKSFNVASVVTGSPGEIKFRYGSIVLFTVLYVLIIIVGR